MNQYLSLEEYVEKIVQRKSYRKLITYICKKKHNKINDELLSIIDEQYRMFLCELFDVWCKIRDKESDALG